MAKVKFTVSYAVPAAKRKEYIGIVTQLKELVAAQGAEYNVYEEEKEPNHFREEYLYNSAEDYEASDDWDNPKINELSESVYKLAVDGKVVYATLHEIV